MNMNKLVMRIFKSRSIQNSEWIIAQQIFQMLLQLIVGVLTARYLGPSNYGTLNYTASFVSFIMAVATLGMDSVLIKKLIDYPEQEGLYLGSTMVFRLIASVMSSISISITVAVLNPDDALKVTLVFLQSFQLSFRAIQILDAWFKRHLKSKYVSIGKMLAGLIVSFYKVFLLFTAKNIVWFAISNSLTDGIVAVVEILFYKKEKGQKLRFNVDIGFSVLKESYHFIISGIMVGLYTQMDRIMIGQLLSDKDVGLYTTAAAICGMWIFIPTAIIDSFQANIMEEKKSGNESRYILRLEQLYSFIIWMCLIVSLCVSVIAGPVVNLMYGSAYMGAVETLKILIWSETFSMIGTARGIWILCENKNRYVKYYLFVGTVINLTLNSILIPRLGINGASFATLATQVTTSIIAPTFFKETRIHTRIVLEAASFKWFWNRKKKGVS